MATRHLFIRVDRLAVCLVEKHRIVHCDNGEYQCEDCTDKTGSFFHEGSLRWTRIYIIPPTSWTNHKHLLVWMGWDGSDNYYKCVHCGVESHAHDHYDSQTKATP